MPFFYTAIVLFLLINLVASMWRVLKGPSIGDSMLAAQLFGTTAVAVLLLWAQASQQPSLHNVALVFALLSAVTAIAFVRRAWGARGASNDH